LGKNGEELETIEGEETHERGGNGDNPRRRRNQGRKIRDTRIDRRRQ